MNNKFSKALVLTLMIMILLVSCTQGSSNATTLDVVNLSENVFMVIKDSELLSSGNLVTINSEESFKEGNLYRVEIEDALAESMAPIASAINVEELGVHSPTKISFEDSEILLSHLPDKTYLIDVRTNEEFSSGHIPGALNTPIDNLEVDFVDSYERDDIFILYCRSGNRSSNAAKILANHGYNLVFDAGGIGSYSGDLEY